MTDLQKQINRLLSYSDSTRNTMQQVRQLAVDRVEAAANREKRDLLALICAGRLKAVGLRMGDTVLHNKVAYRLADVDETGNQVGHRVKPDGSLNPADKVSLYRYRLERVTQL